MRQNRNSSWKTSSNTNQLVKVKVSKTKQIQIITQEKKSIRKNKETPVTSTSKRDQIKQLQFIHMIILAKTHHVFVAAIEENTTIISDGILRF